MARGRTLFLPVIMAVILSATSGQSQVTTSGSPTVGIAPVVTQLDPSQTPTRQDTTLLAKTAAELLPDYIQKGLEKGFDRRV
jgi:hypothetical protein